MTSERLCWCANNAKMRVCCFAADQLSENELKERTPKELKKTSNG